MSGHSKWSTIKRQKGAADVKRGRLFSKLSRAIAIAAKEGGADLETNYKLRLAVEKAKEANMPKENVKRALQRAKGKLGGNKLEEIVFEGYGIGGVAIMVQAVTDNRQRTASEIKSVLEKAGGRLGEKGCVAYLFQPRGLIVIKVESGDIEEAMLTAIDSGAQDVEKANGTVIVYTEPKEVEKIKEQILSHGLVVESTEISLEPRTTVQITDLNKANKLLSLMDKLEDLDDTQKVYAGFDVPEQILAELSQKKA